MFDNYIFMHKDKPCGVVAIDRESGALLEFAAIDRAYLPFLGGADLSKMKTWWSHRAIPGNRSDMREVIRRSGCSNSPLYLAKNLALSITDTYWICPADIELSWDEVSLHRMYGKGNEIIAYHNGTSYDPNASLGGQMNKYWDLSCNPPKLVKKAYEYYGQQSINEMFAAEVHARQKAEVPFVMYTGMDADDNAVLSCCNAFTTENLEFVPAYEVLRSKRLKNNRSEFDQYIDICEENGIDRADMQSFMDYLVLSDFAISNSDEHLQNFGILRNADTMQLIGPAPIFDSGNSMFFNLTGKQPLNRKELLGQTISSFHTSEEKMLKHVKNKSILKADLLPSVNEVEEFYRSHGLPKDRAEFIAGSYGNKHTLLKDFQAGISISLYNR